MMRIKEAIRQSIAVKEHILQDEAMLASIEKVSELCVRALQGGNKILFCGNGGSAADAQHLAAELSGRFYLDRAPLAAEALHVNTSFLTAVANDYSFDEVYSRLVEGIGRPGDVLIGFSTSGNSRNVVKALEKAAEKGMVTVGLTGATGGEIKDVAAFTLKVPSDDTPRIQESHIMIGHLICELIEKKLFSK